MTPQELLNHTPIRTVKHNGVNNEDVFDIIKSGIIDHLPEVCGLDTDAFIWHEAIAAMDNSLMIKIHHEFEGKSSVIEMIGVLYYTHIPVMIISHKGCFGNVTNRWILNSPMFINMISHLESLVSELDRNSIKSVDPTKNIPDLEL